MSSILNATTTSGLVTSADNSGSLQLQTNNGTTAVTIDTSQNVGIGTSSPNQTGFASPVLSITNGTSGIVELIGTQASDGTVGQIAWYNTSAPARIAQILGLRSGANNSGAITFQTSSAGSLAERMRITSGGSVLVGTTTQNVYNADFTQRVVGSGGYILQVQGAGASTDAVQWVHNTNTSGTRGLIQFVVSGSTTVGKISSDGSTTTYGTSSDYRLKENVQPMVGALAKVANLKPVTYIWKNTGSTGEGFIAHELAEVCPYAVVGDKDEVDLNGNPAYQTVDTSFLVATLTAAIQELKAELDATKAEVQALKGVA